MARDKITLRCVNSGPCKPSKRSGTKDVSTHSCYIAKWKEKNPSLSTPGSSWLDVGVSVALSPLVDGAHFYEPLFQAVLPAPFRTLVRNGAGSASPVHV